MNFYNQFDENLFITYLDDYLLSNIDQVRLNTINTITAINNIMNRLNMTSGAIGKHFLFNNYKIIVLLYRS